jgi:hypothetical protein
MSYIVVENFSAGLDTRRHPLTARPGTLQVLKNAHVSRGGEIEKRKKFVSKFELSSGMTFGMLASSETIYVFGSYPGTYSTPAGITFQRLYHPDGHPTLNHYVNEILYATLYGGLPFVIAKFGTGDIYPYYNGSIITDFVNGIARSSMVNLDGFAAHLASCVGEGYTATATGSVITVTGPSGINYDLSVSIDSPMTATVSVSTAYVAPVTESLSKGSLTIAAGSNGNASISRYLNWSDSYADSFPGITGIYIDGVEILGLGSPFHWDSVPEHGLGEYNRGPRMAWTIVSLINASTATSGFSAGYSYHKLSGTDAATFAIYSDPNLGESMNGKKVIFEFDSNQNLGSFATEVTDSPYTTTRFIGTVGTLAGGVENTISSVKVDGLEVLGTPLHWVNSNTDTSLALCAAINAYTSATEFTASLSQGNVILTALAGTGRSPNGKAITVTTTGDVVVGSLRKFDGGVDGVPANSKKYTITLGGTFTPGKTATITVTPTLDPNNPIYFGATRVGISNPKALLTFKTKEHIISGSTLFFSGVNQPTKWGFNGTGAGFINLSNNSGGNEVLTGLALYQGRLAAFARRTVQIWAIDPDPANNVQGQVLSNTGAIGAKSIISIGEIDVFYLSDSGVRSLRARDASNAAIVNDVGTPVDNLILTDLSELTDDEKTKCPCTIEPIDGRYWLAIGSKIYVYSYFPGSQVAAWSTYEPGFEPEHFTTKDGRVYVRPKRGTDGTDPNIETIYLYGGDSGTEYDDSEVEVVLPYLDGGKPAHMKTLGGIDMTCEGYWKVYIGMDPLATSARDLIATVNQPTFSLGRIMAAGQGTHVGVRLVNNTSGYARLANLIAHFDLNEAN